MGQERLGPSYFLISLVLGPLNSLVWYVPSLRYTRGLGWLDSYFLLLQQQLKDTTTQLGAGRKKKKGQVLEPQAALRQEKVGSSVMMMMPFVCSCRNQK